MNDLSFEQLSQGDMPAYVEYLQLGMQACAPLHDNGCVLPPFLLGPYPAPPVPEPSASLLMLTGTLVVMGLLALRRSMAD